MDNVNLFGLFLKEKRCEKRLSLRSLSMSVNLSHIYLYNVENGKRAPSSDENLQKIAIALNLDVESKEMFFDKAASSKAMYDKSNYYLSADISNYISKVPFIKRVLREANKQTKTSLFWDNLLDDLKK